ncbi:MAG: YfhO family protein [Anaerolineales bacterium]|nr:MAG: YfhO family protein [Anaerolineales bacterium]
MDKLRPRFPLKWLRQPYGLPRPDLVIVVILALLPALFFWRLIAPNPADRMSIPAGDFTEQYYPLRAYAARELTAGQLPMWNPSLYGGQPALADIQSGTLYIPQIAQAFLLDWLGLGFPVWALELQAVAHFSWAAFGAYLLGRRLARQADAPLRKARFAGTVVSLVFTYSGYLTGFPVQQLTILEVSAWTPWVLLSMDVLAARSSRPGDRDWKSLVRGWVVAGLTLGLSFLPGHPQTSLYVVYMAVAFYLFRVLSQLPADWNHGSLESWLQTPDRRLPFGIGYLLTSVAYLLPVILLALALAAAQLLPTLEFIAHSPRANLNYAAVSFGLPLHELVSLVYPGYFGGSPEYVGILPLVLIGLALALGRPRASVVFWAVSGLVAMLLAFGGNTFLYPLFYLMAPGFDAVRHQERAFLIYALSAAMLSGYGVLVWVRPLGRLRRARLRRFERGLRIIFGAGLALTALFFYGWVGSEHPDLFEGVLRHHVFGLVLLAGSLILLALRQASALRRPWGMALMAGWIAFNLFSINWRFNLEQPGPTGPFDPTPLTEFLKAQTSAAREPQRIASAGLLPGGPGAASVYGLHDITGNTPLHLDSFEAFETTVPEWRRWQLMNVNYVLSERDLEGPGLSQVFPPGEAQGDKNQARVYAMGDPFPRAWVVHAVEIIPDPASALTRLGADELDLRQVAVVAEALGIALPGPTHGSWVRVAGLASNEITLEVEAVADGLLVLSEIYYPGWRASVNDEPARLVRANGILRGVPLPQGHHTVRLWYAPLSVQVGLALSGLTLILSLVLAAWTMMPTTVLPCAP